MRVMGAPGGPYEGQVWDGVRWSDPGLPVVSTQQLARRRRRHGLIAVMAVLVVVVLAAAALMWGRATFGLECSQRAVDDFDRLAADLPWQTVGGPPSTDRLMLFRAVGGSGATDECGQFIVAVQADQGTVLMGLSDVLRDAGFANDIATGGSDSGPRRTFIEGRDGDGRTMTITLYEQPDGSGTLLDAYVTNP